MPAESSDLRTAAQAAAYLNLHVRTTRAWMASGAIPATLVKGAWQVRREDLDAWVESRRIRPGAKRRRRG